MNNKSEQANYTTSDKYYIQFIRDNFNYLSNNKENQLTNYPILCEHIYALYRRGYKVSEISNITSDNRTKQFANRKLIRNIVNELEAVKARKGVRKLA